MTIFSATYTDIIKFNRKPNEDFYLVSFFIPLKRDKELKKRPIFALADGVTQSRFEDGTYAYPAGAKAAAEIFCNSFVEYMEKNFRPDKKIIKAAFDFANQRIWELNKNEGMVEELDYVVHDYFDTVGVAGFLTKNTLFYGYVGDCGLAVFDRNNVLKFQTRDEVEPAVARARSQYKNWDGMAQNERTKIFHRDFRNNPSGHGYGSFTGEPGVKRYYKIDSMAIEPGDLVIFYSDGFVEYLKFPEFIKILKSQDRKALDEFTFKKAKEQVFISEKFRNKENYQKFGTDRTLISINF